MIADFKDGEGRWGCAAIIFTKHPPWEKKTSHREGIPDECSVDFKFRPYAEGSPSP